MGFKKIIKSILNEGHHGGHHYKYGGQHDNRYREPQVHPSTQQQFMSNTLICESCNYPNKADHKFCSECGQTLLKVKTCLGCGTSIGTNSKFCTECGKML